MEAAIEYKRDHPSESFNSTAARFHVASSTLHDHLMGTQTTPGGRILRNLSIPQETALLDKINAYAERGTLLTPQNISHLARALCEHDLGKSWTSTFLRRHKDQVSSRFYRVQELARLKANTPSNRAAFFDLIGHLPA